MAHVENKLRNLLEQIALEQGYKNYTLNITAISSGGANYSSVLYKAKVEEKDKNALNLFIKVAVLGDDLRDNFDVKIYEAERYVYKTMKRIFRELEDRHNVAIEDRLLMPKYYGAHTVVKEEMLVLEDLTTKGFLTYDRQKSVDWPYASAAVRELAKFHALAMAFHKEYPQEYEKFIRDFTTQWMTEDIYDMFIKTGFKKALEAVKDEHKDKMKKFLDTMDITMILNLNQPVRKSVLTHTDYRASNLMHRYREDGSIELVPVDYQTMRPGCVIIDLLYFIFTGTDEEFRRLHYQRLIEYYYAELSAAMTRLGVESSYYSKDDFDFELKERLPYGLIVAAFSLPIVLIESEDVPSLEQGLEMTTFANCKTSNLYPERLNGIVDDYVRWGILK